MNLLAVQYRGSILFHCCRSIGPGDELLVWPSRQLLQLFSATWTQVWLMRLNARGDLRPLLALSSPSLPPYLLSECAANPLLSCCLLWCLQRAAAPPALLRSSCVPAAS